MGLQHKLTNTSVLSITKKGRHSDGGGLYLNVSQTGSKSWVVMWVRNGRRGKMGLGPFGRGTAKVSLAMARQMTRTKYALPLRALPVEQMSVEDILAVLKPLWVSKSETASRLC